MLYWQGLGGEVIDTETGEAYDVNNISAFWGINSDPVIWGLISRLSGIRYDKFDRMLAEHIVGMEFIPMDMPDEVYEGVSWVKNGVLLGKHGYYVSLYSFLKTAGLSKNQIYLPYLFGGHVCVQFDADAVSFMSKVAVMGRK